MWFLSRRLVNKIMTHAQRSLPGECVGIITGTGNRLDGWHPLTNIALDDRQFLADPQEQIRLFQRLREEQREVLAIYHSHPNGPAEPSALDLELANYPDTLTLIVSLDMNGRLDMNGFLRCNGQMKQQELVLYD